MLLVKKDFLMPDITLSELTHGRRRRYAPNNQVAENSDYLSHSGRRGSTRTPGGKPAHMHRVYEIFEVMPNGTPQRVTVISGVEFAKLALQGLAKRTKNECFAADAKTRQVVLQINVPRQKWEATKHIFQISYDEEAGVQRAQLLKARGYPVVSTIGNDAAKVALTS